MAEARKEILPGDPLYIETTSVGAEEVPRDSLFGVTPPSPESLERAASLEPPPLEARKQTLRDTLEPPPEDRPPSLFLPFELLSGRDEIITLDNWKDRTLVEADADTSLLPPGAIFTRELADGSFQDFEVTEDSIPNFESGRVREEEFDALPDYSYIYLDGELGIKQPIARNPSQIAWDRLIGADQLDDLALSVHMSRLGFQLTAGLAATRAAAAIPIPHPVVRGVVALGAGSLAFAGTALAPETMMEWGEASGLLPPGYRESHGYDDEDLRRLFQGELLLDAHFGLGLGGLRSVGRTLYRSQIPQEMMRLATETAQRGYHMLPIQLTGGNAISRGYIGVIGRFPLMAGKLAERGAATVRGYADIVKGVPARFHTLVGMNATSEAILRDAKGLLNAVNDEMSDRYVRIFDEATQNGIKVIPQDTLLTARKIREEIAGSPLVNDMGKAGELDADSKQFIAMLDKYILNVVQPKARRPRQIRVGEIPPAARPQILEGGEALAGVPQDLKALDDLMGTLDGEISNLRAKKHDGKMPLGLGGHYKDLRQAVKDDLVRNVVEPGVVNEAGEQLYKRTTDGVASKIANDLKVLDEQFSSLMQNLFETAGAKSLASVEAQGLKAFKLASETATRQNIDTLMSSLAPAFRKSPETVRDIRKLVDETTFRKMASSYFNQILDSAVVGVGDDISVKSPSFLLSKFGVREPTSTEFLVLREFLDGMRMAADPEDIAKIITMPQLTDILKSGELISQIEIPNVSLFVARRALLAGASGGARAMLPLGGAFLGAGGAAALFGIPGILMSVGALLGSRGIGNMLSNPLTARALKDVIQGEITGVVNKKAALQLIRGTFRAGAALGDYSAEEAQELLQTYDGMLDMWDEMSEEDLNNPPQEVLDIEAEIDEPVVEEVVADQAAIAVPPIAVPPAPPITETVPGPAAQFTDPNLLAAAPQMAAPAPPAGGGVDSAMRERYAALYPNDMVSELIGQGVGSLPA